MDLFLDNDFTCLCKVFGKKKTIVRTKAANVTKNSNNKIQTKGSSKTKVMTSAVPKNSKK